MAKEKTVYVCSNCGQESPKWVGKCPSCGEWNTYVEEIVRKEVPNKRPVSGIESPKAKPVTLSEIEDGTWSIGWIVTRNASTATTSV